MGIYVETSELDKFLLGAANADPDKKAFAVLSASRLFDSFAQVPDDFFAVASSTASVKILGGSGVSILSLPPFVGSLGAVVFDDGTVSGQTIDSSVYAVQGLAPGQYLETFRYPMNNYFWRDWYPIFGYENGAGYWRTGQNYKISARWGFAAIPEDVKAAVIQIAISIMSDLDTAKAARLGARNDEKNHLPENSIAGITAKKYRGKMLSGFAI